MRVLQTKAEGGMNLNMDAPTITGLAERGRTAAGVIVEQFTEPRYPESAPVATGWDNHRWVRYRALLAALPDWSRAFGLGHAALDIEPSVAAELPADRRGTCAHAARLTGALDQLAEIVSTADPVVLEGLTSAPRPRGMIRRIPQI